jgi:tetratricopeptide (TPR) repeat protein
MKRVVFCFATFVVLPIISAQAQVSDAVLLKVNDAIFTAPERAKKSADSLLALYPENYKVINIIGNYYWLQGDRNTAVRHYSQSMQKAPKQITAYQRMAEFFNEKGMNEKALELLDNGIAINPDAALYTKRALIHFSMNNFALAKADDETAIQLKNDDIYSYANAALSAYNLNESNPTRYFEQAEKVASIPRAELWLRQGIYYAAGPGDYALAKTYFDRVFQESQYPYFSAGDLNLIGITAYKNKEYDNAIRIFMASLQRQEDPDVMGNLASVYVDLQQWEKLRDYAQTMVQKYPDHVMANGYYGVALIRTGQNSLGEQYLKKAETLQQQ